MRGVTAALVLILAACSTAGGDTTTTTAPLTEPSTTSTIAPSITTTEATTTTAATEEECTERNGVLRNRRGFVCPPWLISLDFVGIGTGQTAIHLPGTYDTRQFIPRFRFTREEQFVTVGENSDAVAMVLPFSEGQPGFFAWSGDAALQAAAWPDLVPSGRPTDWIWAEDLETREIEVGGHPGTLTTLTANCRYETKVIPEFCTFPSPAFQGGLYIWHGAQGAVITIDTSEPMTFTAFADGPAFDEFWTEVAQPILDSIEFVDP